MSDERKHHPFGCSQWPMLWECSAYKSTSGNSSAAERGTRIHKYWEMLGKSEELPEGYDFEEAARAQWALEALDELAQGADIEWEILIENDDPEYFGYADAVWQSDATTLHVADGKSGQGNDLQWVQLIGYAAALLKERTEIENVVLHFVYWNTELLKTYEFSRVAVFNKVDELLTRIAEGNRKVGVGCKYCANYEGCPETQKPLFRVWQTDWESAWEQPDMLGALKDDLDFVASMHDRVKSKIKELVHSGVDVPGMRVSTRPGASKVDTVKAYEALKGTVSEEEFLQCMKADLKQLQSLHLLKTGQQLEGDYIQPGPEIKVLRKA